MTQTQEQIEKLRTLQESLDFYADVAENQLPLLSKESTLQEESAAIQSKIDNIKLPEIDTTELAKEATLNAVSSKLDNINVEVDLSNVAKQGDNQDASNTAIYALLSQFGESVLQEKVTVILNCQESIVWQDYTVNVTFEDGRTQAVPLSENGTCSFSIKIGQNYSVQLPLVGVFVMPELKTYTAISSAREIYWSYVATGVFGMDELGRRYSIAQIEALSDKSIIKYGGYTDFELENAQKADGTYGCGFMWDLNQESISAAWASSDIEFNQDWLPFIQDKSTALLYYDGEAYTRYIILEGIRLGTNTPAATKCQSEELTVSGVTKHGFLPSFAQIIKLATNITSFNALYTALGLTAPTITSGAWWTSCQYDASKAVFHENKALVYRDKTKSFIIFVCFSL